MVINSQDQITEAVAYQAYGAMIPLDSIANAPEIPAREKFTGKEFDTEGEDSANGVAGIQVYHFGARVYDPDVGVWLSVDPKEQLFYRYGYSTSPVNTVDPDGQFIWSLINTAAQWYVGNAITQGSLNPGKWNWDDPMLMAGTMITAMGMIGAAGNYFENLAKSNHLQGAQSELGVNSEKEFWGKMGNQIDPPKEWRAKFENEVAVPCENEALNPTDKMVNKSGLSVYESRKFVYTKGTDVKGGKMQPWMPVDGADNFTPAGSNFEPIPKGYTRNLAHFHHKYPWLSQDDLTMLQNKIDLGILPAKAKIFAISRSYISVVGNNGVRAFWVR